MQNDIVEFLTELPLFKSFSPDEIEELVSKSRLLEFNEGDIIIRFGEPGKLLGIIIKGEAEASVQIDDSNKQILGSVKPGEFVGEMSLLTGEPTTADIIATQTCEMLIVDQDVFSAFIASNPQAIKIMARVMSERIRSRLTDEDAEKWGKQALQKNPDPYGLHLSTTGPMKILTINCGSSSLKFGYFNTAENDGGVKGIIERIGLENTRLSVTSGRVKFERMLGKIDHTGAVRTVAELLTSPEFNILEDLDELTVVSHRVVHGGVHGGSVVITPDVIENIAENVKFAPIHNPINLAGIQECIRLMPGVTQVAVFDTSFHQKMPSYAYLYGLPYELFEKKGIRRYGFHGISHNFAALKAAEYMKKDFHELKIISCHLGSGASICAIDHGRSVDTSMGFTPLEGLIMGTRCGDIDPSIVTYLCRDHNLAIDEVERLLNHDSGLKGLSGISSDFRELEEAANRGDNMAVAALQCFCYRVRKYIGSYIAAIGGIDALVFTGGIGEGSAWARSLSCQGLYYMGIEIDDLANSTVPKGSDKRNIVYDIGSEHGKVKVLIVPSDEETMLAREAIHSLGNSNAMQILKNQREKKIPIEVSAHHVHLSASAVEKLFGENHELTRKSSLSQPGQYACEETVDLIGPKGRVERVRVLGPLRNDCQAEISMTEEYKLGLQAPVRASGDLMGSPGIALQGPNGVYEMNNGVICALRHIHMSPADALAMGIKDHDIVMVETRGDRNLTFGEVLVRINPDFKLSMHIDTDEANAAGIKTGTEGYIVGIADRI